MLRSFTIILFIWGIAYMTKKQAWSLTGIVLCFLALLALAVLFESELFIYAASALPILMVLLLPDIRQNQYIRSRKDRPLIQLQKVVNGDESLLVVSFQPGYVRWHCKQLYFDLNELSPDPIPAMPQTGNAASIPVLPFDLTPHPHRAGWFGINLSQLAHRMVNQSYTTEEVARFVISMNDLESIALLMKSQPAAAVSGKSESKSISA
jgi:hypothetical protein